MLKNVRLWIDNPDTGEIHTTFICSECGQELPEADASQIKISSGEFVFKCKKCYAAALERRVELYEAERSCWSPWKRFWHDLLY